MMQVLATMAVLWLLILVAPETPIARVVRRALVDRPAARLNRLSRGHLSLAAIAGIVIATVAWMGEGDAVRMLVMAAPESVTWLTTVEIAAWLDVGIAAVAAWSAARLRLPLLLSTRRGSRIRRRQAVTRTPLRAANDDEPGDRRRCA